MAKDDKITPAIRNSNHKWFRHIEDQLNHNGITIPMALENKVDVEFTEGSFKYVIYSKLLKRMTGKKSTELATREENAAINEAINLFLANFGIHVPYPCKETLAETELAKRHK